MTFAEMISVATKLNDLLGFLESGDFATLMADVELEAAKEAFERIPYSKDQVAQTWTCIGHLNSCYNGYATAIRQMTVMDRTIWSRCEHFEAVRTKECFVLCIRAICHRYVGELRHSGDDLNLAQSLRKVDLSEGGHPYLWFASGLVINPFVALDVFRIAKEKAAQKAFRYQLSDAEFQTFTALFKVR